MSQLTIAPVQMRTVPSGTEVLFTARLPEGEQHVRVTHSLRDAPGAAGTMLGDAALALFLLPAMRRGWTLEIQNPVSEGLMQRTGVLQEIFGCWYPVEFAAKVEVRAPVAPTAVVAAASGRGCFFSGGVDSFFSLLKHRDALDRAIFVHGFDLALAKSELRRQVSTSMQEAAADLGIPLVEVVTDVRSFADRHVHWGSHFCGAAMAMVGHLLSPWLGEIIIPATTTYAHLEPFGTHLYTDERWAGDALTLHHDGMEARRIDKMRAIVQHEVVRKHLRVCWENRGERYNCGRCEKCLRTMANLRALGVLEQCTTFPSTIDLPMIRDMEVDHPLVVPFLEETIEAALAAEDSELAGAVRRCILEYEARTLAWELTPLREYLPETPEWIKKAAPRFRDAILESCWQQDPEWTRQEMGRHFSQDADAAFDLLWKHDRWWLIRQMIASRLRRLLPGRRQRESSTSPDSRPTPS